jgi:hypothetical protein
MNTMNDFKKALDDAIYTYGQCLLSDMDATGLTEELEKWLEMSVDISDRLDEALYNKEEQQ